MPAQIDYLFDIWTIQLDGRPLFANNRDMYVMIVASRGVALTLLLCSHIARSMV